jgi:BlaI family transcriptional regulator, penicillinase repressor
MARTNVPRPTEAELGILGVLWNRGPSTVREVHSELARSRPLGYTTVLKLLQIMSEKGLVRRNERERAHVYAARIPEAETQRQLVGDLVDRAFGGSAARLVQQALASKKTSPEEISRIREFLAEMERGHK